MRTTRGMVVMALLATLTLLFAVPKSGLAVAILPDLGTAGSFGVLAGSAVTNTGPTTVDGNVGVSPGTAVTGFPPGTLSGTIHAGDSVALQAHNDATTAYGDAAGQACDFNLTGQDLGGKTLIPGVYCFDSSAQLTGQLTLDGQGNRNSVYIFQVGSTLTTASNGNVQVINNAQPCNVFWQIGSSATLGTNTHFAGNILALTSITLNTGTTSSAGLYALNGAVTLDSNTIHACSFVQASTSTPTPVSTHTAVATSTGVPRATNTPVPGATNTTMPAPATDTPIPPATSTPVNTPTNVPARTPRPRPTNVPTVTPGTIRTLTPINTSIPPPANTVVPTDTTSPNGTVLPNDTATSTALAYESPVPSTTALATDTAISTPLTTATDITIVTGTSTPTTGIAISTATAAVTVVGTSTAVSTASVPGATSVTTQVTMYPSPFLPRTGNGADPWTGTIALLLSVLLLLVGLAVRMLFRKVKREKVR